MESRHVPAVFYKFRQQEIIAEQTIDERIQRGIFSQIHSRKRIGYSPPNEISNYFSFKWRKYPVPRPIMASTSIITDVSSAMLPALHSRLLLFLITFPWSSLCRVSVCLWVMRVWLALDASRSVFTVDVGFSISSSFPAPLSFLLRRPSKKQPHFN